MTLTDAPAKNHGTAAAILTGRKFQVSAASARFPVITFASSGIDCTVSGNLRTNVVTMITAMVTSPAHNAIGARHLGDPCFQAFCSICLARCLRAMKTAHLYITLAVVVDIKALRTLLANVTWVPPKLRTPSIANEKTAVITATRPIIGARTSKRRRSPSTGMRNPSLFSVSSISRWLSA